MRRKRSVRMRISVVSVLSVLFAPSALYAQRPGTEIYQGKTVAAMEILVKPTQRTSAAISALSQAFDADYVVGIGSNGWVRLHSRSKNVAGLVTQAATRADIARFEPNYPLVFSSPPDNIPNDFYIWNLWGLTRIGAPKAWNYSTGEASDPVTGHTAGVVVGLIDTGILESHPDLAQNIWTAPTDFCVCVGGTSPDCNGCTGTASTGYPISCPRGSHGWDEYQWSSRSPSSSVVCSPTDNYVHGTHVAGTIGARGNNGMGLVGVNWAASIMDVKIYNSASDPLAMTTDGINAISFAVGTKAFFANTTTPVNVRVLSNSYGIVDTYSSAYRDEINTANRAGMLFVAAAGNDYQDNDSVLHLPANYGAPPPYNQCSTQPCDALPNVIAVLNTDENDNLYSYVDPRTGQRRGSDWGRNTVHLGAPGTDIFSTWKNIDQSPGYASQTGTSMATPHVSGTALLMLSRCSLTTAGVKSMILSNVDLLSSLAYDTITTGTIPYPGATGGRLNAYNAIRACAAQRPYPAETDANGDSYGDLFVYDPSNGNEYTLLSKGDGSYSGILNNGLGASYTTLLRGDFNGDRFADLYAYNIGNGLSAVGLSNPSGGITMPPAQVISPGYNFIETGDFNGDGKTDILLYNSSSDAMYIGLSDGTGGFNFAYNYVSPGFTSVVVGDFNGDGWADLVLYNKYNAAGYLLIGKGDGTFQQGSSLFLGSNYGTVITGDINGDGRSDLVIYNATDGTLYVGIANPDGTFNAPNTWHYNLVSPNFTTVALTDFDGDGLGDLLLYNANNSAGYVGIGNGSGTYPTFAPVFFGGGYDTVSIQDLNGDGMQDVVIYNSSLRTAYWGISQVTYSPGPTWNNFAWSQAWSFGSRIIAR